jgi:hypothetical protein
MIYPTSWLVMRVGDPVPVQNYGHILEINAMWKARQYAAATAGEFELVEIEHIEREKRRIKVIP